MIRTKATKATKTVFTSLQKSKANKMKKAYVTTAALTTLSGILFTIQSCSICISNFSSKFNIVQTQKHGGRKATTISSTSHKSFSNEKQQHKVTFPESHIRTLLSKNSIQSGTISRRLLRVNYQIKSMIKTFNNQYRSYTTTEVQYKCFYDSTKV